MSSLARTHADKELMFGPSNLIVVQPLQRSEMQSSYAQDLGVESVGEHGLYVSCDVARCSGAPLILGLQGSFVNACGDILGACGVIPCCPCSNPFRSVGQGSVGLVSRCAAHSCSERLPLTARQLRPILCAAPSASASFALITVHRQVGRPRAGEDQHSEREPAHRRRQVGRGQRRSAI